MFEEVYKDDDLIEECNKCKAHLEDYSRLCCTECSNQERVAVPMTVSFFWPNS